jgi:hypothetical protein
MTGRDKPPAVIFQRKYMLQKPNIAAAPAVRVMINVGATMDIPTGWYVKGKYCENILLGGLEVITFTCDGVYGSKPT